MKFQNGGIVKIGESVPAIVTLVKRPKCDAWADVCVTACYEGRLVGFVEEDHDVVELKFATLNGLSDAHSGVNRVKSHQTKPRL